MHTSEPLTTDPRRAHTLPGRVYTDPAILAEEQEKIFARSWQYATHASRLAEIGDYVATWFVGQGVFLIRGKDGVVRGFHNVCQHRAHELLRGSGRAKVITCPYHAWSYHADGRLRGARGSEKVEGFDGGAFCLKPVKVDRLLDFYFVNLDLDAPSMAETYPGVAEEIAAHVPFLSELVHVEQPGGDPATPPPADLAANWKVLAENCMECYHCAPAHPAFVDLVDIKSYRIANHGTWISSLSRAGNPENKAYRFGPDEASQRADFWYLWPNTTLNILPGVAQMVAFRFEPVDVGTTRTINDVVRAPGAVISEDRRNYGGNVLWQEDKGICEAVQRGLRSRGYSRGRFIVDRDMTEISEHGVHQVQMLWAKAMGYPVSA